ncbi:MAG: acyl carrier protein [Bacillota bacterium]|nr:acyl carrier protein [Bacillota bacterium]
MLMKQIVDLISKQLKADASAITRESRLVEDLGADSANVMVLIMDLEDQFNIQIEDNAITTLKTVGDVVDYIQELQG